MKETIESQLKNYIDPYLETDLITANAVKSITLEKGHLTLDIELGYPFEGVRESMQSAIEEVARAPLEVHDVTLNLASKIYAHDVQQPNIQALKGVKNIIAVASGKGGVGKSTLAVNLALALKADGANVGILDADIYGPNQPQMLGVTKKPTAKNKKVEPIVQYGIQSMSIGYLIDADQPMIWRGPMVGSALQQLANDTNWQDLDYLILDLPPGTGDVQLTMAQKMPVAGSVVVTTPQPIALADARKGVAMFQKVKVPVLGVVENMSYFICDNCDKQHYIFGRSGGAKMAAQYNLPFLGEVPLDPSIREQADSGEPTVQQAPDTEIAHIYREIARKMAAQLSLTPKNYAMKFPNIVVE